MAQPKPKGGPTAGLPPLREELALLPGAVLPDGQPSWTLHDPVRNLFFRLDWLTFEILSRWSMGVVDAIVQSIATATTLKPNVKEVEQVAQFLTDNQLVQVQGRDSAGKLAERLRSIEGTPLKWLLHHYLFIRVPLWRPDGWLDRWQDVAALFYTRTFALLTLGVMLLGFALVARQWDVFFASLVDTFSLEGLMAYGVALICVKLLHELGHAFTAKRLGCRIPAMGVAFIVLWPMAYTDTNETWRLTSHWQRLKVACAGIATELLIAVWATLAWALLPEGGLRGAMFYLATTSWVATLAINASPFLRFDGYFILCDLLDMPNLHGRSFALARWKLREWLFALGEPKPEYFLPRKEFWLITFAWVTWIYRLLVFLGIALLVYYMFTKVLGIFLFVVEIIWFVALPIYRELQAWKERWPRIREQSASRSRMRKVLLWGGLLLVLLVLPLPSRVSSSGILRPVDSWAAFLPAGAELRQVMQAEGSRVAAGSDLFELAPPELLARVQVLDARLARLRWQAASAGLSDETRNRLLVSQEEWAMAEAERAALDEELARYAVRAPFEGQLRDVDPDLAPGQWLKGRERLATLVGSGKMLVETYLDEESVRRVQAGDGGIFMTDGRDGPVLRLRLLQVDADATRVLPNGMLSAAAGGHILTRDRQGQRIPEHAIYRAVLEVESSPGVLAGQSWRGRVVIRGRMQSLASPYVRQMLSVLVRESGL